MLVLLATIAAFLVDVFAGSALLGGERLYLGAALVFFLTRARRGSALAAAVTYGLLLDIASVALPFGTFTLALAVLWLALAAVRGSISHAPAHRTFAALFLTLVAYGFALASLERLAVFLATDIATRPLGDAAKAALFASAITLLLCAGFIAALHIVRAHVKKWFFIK